MKILMCPPEYFDISYTINPWMNPEKKVNTSLAKQQWTQLFETIQHCGAEIHLIEPQANWPDMVFTANAGLPYKKNLYLSQFRHSERRGEQDYFQDWFEKNNHTVTTQHEYCFEGAGDALLTDTHFFAASGFRSDPGIYQKLQKEIPLPLVLVELNDPYYYHLDTCFCPLNTQNALWWPEAFTPDSQRMLQKHITCHAVPQEEAKHFACNSVVIHNNVIIPSDCPKTAVILNNLGFTTHSLAMTEFIKSGGACKCLTLKIS